MTNKEKYEEIKQIIIEEKEILRTIAKTAEDHDLLMRVDAQCKKLYSLGEMLYEITGIAYNQPNETYKSDFEKEKEDLQNFIDNM